MNLLLALMRRGSVAKLVTLTCFAIALTPAPGCKVNSEDIQRWQRTQKGPERLQIVIANHRHPYSDELRVEAADTLAHVDRPNADGLSLLREALSKLQRTRPDEAKMVAEGLVARVLPRFKNADDPMATDVPDQVHAKDTVYVAIPLLGEQALTQASEVLVRWYIADFSARSAMGDYSVEQVFAALGPSVSSRLVEAMDAHIPQASLVKIAEIVARSGNKAAQSQAARALITIEREILTSSQFSDWLKQAIVNNSKLTGTKLDAERLQLAVELTRERFLTEGVLPAMKYLASEPLISSRLLQVAETRPPAASSNEEKERMEYRRQAALQALESKVTVAHLERLLAIALNSGDSMLIRDLAFDRIGDIGSRNAIPSLWHLVQNGSSNTAEKRLRWRAGELVLTLGGHSILDDFFARLPGGESEPEELEGYAARMSQMSPPPTDELREKLHAPAWNARVIALRYFQRRGVPSDRADVSRLVTDKANLSGKGWKLLEPPAATVGDIAHVVAESLNAPEPKS